MDTDNRINPNCFAIFVLLPVNPPVNLKFCSKNAEHPEAAE